MKKIIMLSCDPGLRNHSFCVTEYTKRSRKVLIAGMFDYTINSLLKKDLDTQYKQYVRQIYKLIKKYNPTHISLERYQNRGFRGGQSIVECVNVMLGIWLNIAKKKKIDITLIPAVTWKNDFQKNYKDLPSIYEEGATYRIPPHVIDGCLIGWYVAKQLGYYSYIYLYKDQTKWLKTFKKLMDN